MASRTANNPVCEKPFPVQLALGVLQDLLAKELDALLSPSDEGKKAAFEASHANLPRRLQLLTSQIAATDPAELPQGLCGLVTSFWTLLSNRADLASVQPSMLESSVSLETLSAVFAACCSALGPNELAVTDGGVLVAAALDGLGQSPVPHTQTGTTQLVTLLEWWGDEVVSKRWGVMDTWGYCTHLKDDETMNPLHLIAFRGLTAFVPLALAKGCPANGSFAGSSRNCPAAIAFKKGHMDIFEALLARGLDLLRPYEEDGWPLVLSMFGEGAAQASQLGDLLRRHPEIIRASASDKALNRVNLLGAAIFSRDPDLVDLVLTAGAPVEYRSSSAEDRVNLDPSIVHALFVGKRRILELLITEGKVLEGWKEKYDRAAAIRIAQLLTRLAIAMYPSNPYFKGDPERLVKHNPEAMECLELALATGFVCESYTAGERSLLQELYVNQQGSFKGCVLQEDHALRVIKRFHSAGFDVGHWWAEHDGEEFQLQHAAASAGHNEVLDWRLGQLGLPGEAARPEAVADLQVLLLYAILYSNAAGALLLLTKYKARAAYPERPLEEQPVYQLMEKLSGYTDQEAALVLAALIERDPGLFDLPCFSERAVAKAETAARESGRLPLTHSFSCWNPLFDLSLGKPKALELLLTKRLPGVAAMAHRRVNVPVDGSLGAARLPVTPAQMAANAGQWECLGLLLRHTDTRVTDSIRSDVASVAEHVRREEGEPRGPPRPLVALVKARAKKELEGKAATAAASQAAGAFTNAFEDPSAKDLSKREEKKKSQKKAAKKKAKAKKRAAANAGAGGSAAPHESSDEDADDDDNEEEPDDNLVDSRYAPSVDVMFAAMGLGPGGAAVDGTGGAGSSSSPAS